MSTAIERALAELRAIPMRKPVAPAPAPAPKAKKPRRKRGPVKCGTYSGYVHHKKQGQEACADCLAAKREYYRTYYEANAERINAQRRKARAVGRDLPETGGEGR